MIFRKSDNNCSQNNFIYLAILFILFTTSCTSLKKIVLFNQEDTEKLNEELYSIESDYIIKNGDLLSIHLQDIEYETYSYLTTNMNRIVNTNSSDYEKGILVEKNGYLNLPFIDSLNVEGMTIIELRDSLESKYQKYLQNPTVIVKVLNLYIDILGEVKKPGKISASAENLTLLEAISRAGGLTLGGDRQNVQLIRRTEDGGNKKYLIDLTSAHTAFPKQIYLQRGDFIYVPESRRTFRRTDLQYVSISVAMITNLITMYYILFKR